MGRSHRVKPGSDHGGVKQAQNHRLVGILAPLETHTLNVGIMEMKRNKKIGIAIMVALVVVLAGGWLLSEVRWARINKPTGKFSNVREYLADGRLPSRVTRVKKDGKTFFIAHSPLDTWLAFPAAPAAYVFNETGEMVEWCSDPGDNSGFQKKWPLPQDKSSVDELKRIGFQPSAGGDGKPAPQP